MIRAALGLIFAAAACLASPAEAQDGATNKASIESIIAAAKRSMVVDPGQALAQAQRVDLLSRQLTNRRDRVVASATARWLAGEAQLRLNETGRAGALLSDGLRLLDSVRGPGKLHGDLLMSQGAYFAATGRAAQALANYHLAYRNFTDASERRSAAVALQNIAMLYSAANDVDRAERYYLQAADIYKGDPVFSLSLRNNLGSVFLRSERYALAEAQFLQALVPAQAMDDPVLEARILGNLARAQINLRKYAAAEQTLGRGFWLLKDRQAMTRRHLLASAAHLADERGNIARAQKLIVEAFEGLDLSSTTADLTVAHLYAYNIFRRLGEARLALAHLEALKRLDDEAAKVATTTSAALMAAKFDYQGQQLTIERLTSEQLRKTAEFQRTLFLSLGGATLAVIAMLSWGLLTIRRSRNRVRSANIVLHHTNTALEKALAARTEFLATTSHEIRTPLNGILGMTQVMLSDQDLPPDMRERLGVVHGAGVTMRSLVDDILDVAKMETGNLAIDPIPMNLREMLAQVTPMWEGQARTKGLSFRLEIGSAPEWILADAGRLRQIVFNLLSNAVKFTARGGITVRVLTEGAGTSRRLRVVVSDTGIGIPGDKLGEIFESFRQVDASTTRQYGGTGLGLTICRNLAVAMGGDIEVESREGEGATFVLDLPLVSVTAPAESREAPSAAPVLLVVDRNPIMRSMLRSLFGAHPVVLQFASDVEEAVQALHAHEVASVLIDEAALKAGAESPFDRLTRVADAAGERRVLVLWGDPDLDVREALQARGADQIVGKPVSGSDLVAAILSSDTPKSDQPPAGRLVSRAA